MCIHKICLVTFVSPGYVFGIFVVVVESACMGHGLIWVCYVFGAEISDGINAGHRVLRSTQVLRLMILER